MFIFKWATRWTTSAGIRMLCMSTGQQLLKLKRIIERIEIKNEKRKRVQETMDMVNEDDAVRQIQRLEETIAQQQRQIQALEQSLANSEAHTESILDWLGTNYPRAWDAYMEGCPLSSERSKVRSRSLRNRFEHLYRLSVSR